jgi:hypothetical protein
LSNFGHAAPEVLRPFFADALGPSMLIFLFSAALFTLGSRHRTGPLFEIPQREIVLAISLACIPFLGLAGAELTHGPFIARYFLSTVAGFAILVGFASSRGPTRSWGAGILAGFMFFLMLGDLAKAVYLQLRHEDYKLIGPSSGFHFGPSAQNPLGNNTALLGPTNDEDIIVLQAIDYLYFYTYSPQTLARHLVFATLSRTDLFLGEYQRLAALAHVDVRATTFATFLATHEKFFVYGRSMECEDCEQEFLSAGYKLISARRDTNNVLYEYEK